MHEINDAFETITKEVRDSANTAEEASVISRNAHGMLSRSVIKGMDNMKEAMTQITKVVKRNSDFSRETHDNTNKLDSEFASLTALIVAGK